MKVVSQQSVIVTFSLSDNRAAPLHLPLSYHPIKSAGTGELAYSAGEESLLTRLASASAGTEHAVARISPIEHLVDLLS